jgi:uncharacterized protein
VISLYQAAVPPCLQMLGSLAGLLTKAAAHAEAHAIAPDTLLQARLAPDMFPLVRQVQIAADFGRTIGARLTGLPHVSVPDEETSFAELQARIATTVAFLQGLEPAAFEGAETREIVLKFKTREMRMTGLVYLQQFALPNLYFHATAAYAILRQNGVALGKRDFIGTVTLLDAA